MDSAQQPPRRLSRRNSSSNRWRRPLRAKNNSLDSHRPQKDQPDGSAQPSASASASGPSDQRELLADDVLGGHTSDDHPMKSLEDHQSTLSVDTHTACSIIPDPLPSWTEQSLREIPGVGPSVRTKYNLYNPTGPRWYKNHHLIPPQTRMPMSSTFSPSFPPMRTSLGPSSPVEAGRMPGPSRTPSGSPLPTPNASQTRLGDGPGMRSRKISQTAHDNVDMLDGSDPWGTNWHHQSPYDVGINSAPAQSPTTDVCTLCHTLAEYTPRVRVCLNTGLINCYIFSVLSRHKRARMAVEHRAMSSPTRGWLTHRHCHSRRLPSTSQNLRQPHRLVL